MKNIVLLLSLFVIPTFVYAEQTSQKTELIYDSEAVIEFCAPRLVGCATHITIDGQSYLVDPIGQGISGHLSLLEMKYGLAQRYKTLPGQVVGFVVNEKGHFPNPTAQFAVFKIMAMDFQYQDSNE